MNDIKEVFESLNDELAQNDLTINMIAVGGFALQYHDLRTTQDVDAFYEESDKINEKIFLSNQNQAAFK